MINCLIFGTGNACLSRINSLNFKQINIVGILDNDEKKQGAWFFGYKIDSPVNIVNYTYHYILVASSYFSEICGQLNKLGVSREKIIDIQKILTPVASGRSLILNGHLSYDKGYRKGIEIGGAMNPVYLVDRRIELKQLDYTQHTMEENPYKDMPLVKVDIIDDGETLKTIGENSLDFIIACHMLEHCKNPIGTLRVFLSKVCSGGIIFLAIPDKRFTFDRDRKITSFEHLVIDDREAGKDKEYLDYCDMSGVGAVSYTQFLEEDISHFHYHVWDSNSFIDFLYKLQKYLKKGFTIEQAGILDNGMISNEIIVVLKKA